MRQKNAPISTRGFGLSGISVFYLSVIYLALMWLGLLILIPLVHFFPAVKGKNWILAVPCLLVTGMLLAHLLSSFYRVILTEDRVVLSWLRIPLRKLFEQDMRLFCAVGNEREDVLCLTSRTVEEMALLEEKHLLRSFVTKYDVPLIKKKNDWQDVLARKYLNRMRRSPLGIFSDKQILFMTMDPVVQHKIHSLYPQLPYKNYTGVTRNRKNTFFNPKTAPCFWMPTDPCSVEIMDDGIVLRTKKEIKRRFVPEKIRTIVRVDIFRSYDKFFPHHLPVLYVSVYTPEEMVGISKETESSPILQAYRYAEREALHWYVKKENGCNLPCSPEILSQLKSLCGHAQWIDISDGWICDCP